LSYRRQILSFLQYNNFAMILSTLMTTKRGIFFG